MNSNNIRTTAKITSNYGYEFKKYIHNRTSTTSFRAELYHFSERCIEQDGVERVKSFIENELPLVRVAMSEENKLQSWEDYSWNLIINRAKYPLLSQFYDLAPKMVKVSTICNVFFYIYKRSIGSHNLDNQPLHLNEVGSVPALHGRVFESVLDCTKSASDIEDKYSGYDWEQDDVMYMNRTPSLDLER